MSKLKTLQQSLQQELAPEYIEVLDESHMHAGPNLETHCKITLVSAKFIGLSRVKRHQMVYGLAAQQLAAGLHGIALHLYTQDEWQQIQPDFLQSPKCRGAQKPTS